MARAAASAATWALLAPFVCEHIRFPPPPPKIHNFIRLSQNPYLAKQWRLGQSQHGESRSIGHHMGLVGFRQPPDKLLLGRPRLAARLQPCCKCEHFLLGHATMTAV